MRYWNNTLAILSWIVSVDCLWMPYFSTWTARSTSLFEEEWHGAVCTCLIPFIWQISLNSATKNCLPLSDTIISGIPNQAINCLRYWTVAALVAIFIENTSICFEWESITTRNILLSMGPAKSICNLIHGSVGTATDEVELEVDLLCPADILSNV